MDLFTGIITFVLIWWLSIFTVLPWGLQRDETGKPDDPKLALKAILTTLVSVVLWLLIYSLIEADIISFRELSNVMIEEDRQK